MKVSFLDEINAFKLQKHGKVMLDEKKVKDAFGKIKEEQANIVQWIFYLKERIDEFSLSLVQTTALENEIEELKKKMEQKSECASLNLQLPQEIIHQSFTEVSLDQLTEQQKKTFFLVGSLQREHAPVPVRAIAAELYGVENVEKMQTTIANYLKRLEELHLIQRTKKGRNSYVSLSELGMKLLASHHIGTIKASVNTQ